MRKNLALLFILLALVAQAARWDQTRRAREAELTALADDLRAGLEKLWQRPGQDVSIHEGTAVIRVNMPAGGDTTWNEALVNYLVARHPQVQLKRIDLSPPAVAAAEDDLRRQTRDETAKAQEETDSLLGPGRAVVLLQLNYKQTRTWIKYGVPDQSDRSSCLMAEREITETVPVRHVRVFVDVSPHFPVEKVRGGLWAGLRLNEKLGESLEVVSWP
ncbi:MAG: hypothetical protein U0931_11250 [Vulcanimicrobiota bacterium]